VLGVDEDLESELPVIELPGLSQVLRQQDRVHRAVA